MRRNVLFLTAASALATAGLLHAASDARAVSTQSFVFDDAADFARGEVTGAAIESTGAVVRGLALERVDLPGAATAYAMARGADGTLFVGTGNGGVIYAVRGERVETYAETGQLLVTSLAMGRSGVLYAGTLPEGRVYAIPRRGELRELVRVEGAEAVWALAWDDARRTLFAGVGPRARVLGISERGEARTYYEGGSGHVMSLALGTGDTVYAGTSGDALLLRITAPGRAEVLHDFAETEVNAIAVREGVIAVAVGEFPAAPRVAPTTSTKAPTKSVGSSGTPRAGKGRLYRLMPPGELQLLGESNAGHFTAVELRADGDLLAATGAEGRVLRIDRDRATAVVAEVDERQILAMDLAGTPGYLVTGDGAAVYRVAGAATDARWTSPVLDALVTARFGRVELRAEGSLSVSTRSGNTAVPDETWSDWSAPMASAAPIRSPAARYLQARVTLGREGALRSLRAYYLPQNRRAIVTAVRTLPSDTRPSAVHELEWEVDDPDGDRLGYTLRFRNVAGGPSRPLAGASQPLTEKKHRWDTSGIPDGYYVVDVIASDALDNPRALAYASRGSSQPILVDNHPPRVVELRARGATVTGRARDDFGPIARLEVSFDGGAFEPIYPDDHLLDSGDEAFTVQLPAELGMGTHLVAVRATDAAGNAATSETTAVAEARAN